MEKQIERDISRIYKVIGELGTALSRTHKDDQLTLRDIRADLARFESELTRKQTLLHKINQDKEVKNREIEARIDKLLGQGKELEDMSAIYSEIYEQDVNSAGEDSQGGLVGEDSREGSAVAEGDGDRL